MNTSNRLLLAIDDSAASRRVMTYTASLLAQRQDVEVYIFHVHVVDALLPEGLAFAIGEIETEERMEAAEQASLVSWSEEAKQAAQPLFQQAKEILGQAGIPQRALFTQACLATREKDIATEIIEQARAHQCGTVAVGRVSFSRLREYFEHHVADALVRQGHGLTIWVIE